MDLVGKKVFAVITGASGTFGGCITRELLYMAATGGAQSLSLLLHGRESSKARLQALTTELNTAADRANLKLRVRHILLDLEREQPGQMMKHVMQQHVTDADHGFLFNNAGILHPCRVSSAQFSSHLARSFAVNVAAPVGFITSFVNAMPSAATKCFVNISSLAALQPFCSWGSYCITKAAGDMLHKTLAAEHDDIRVLSYAPGPMKTKMTESIASDEDVDPQVRELYARLTYELQFVCPDESARKLMNLLLANKYKNGQHIDFYET